ncbi:MAG: hypothetical protein V1844_01870, partial [Pseudomonadota bacterium]
LLQLLPAGAKVAGRDSHPLKNSAFARRTITCYVNMLSWPDPEPAEAPGITQGAFPFTSLACLKQSQVAL